MYVPVLMSYVRQKVAHKMTVPTTMTKRTLKQNEVQFQKHSLNEALKIKFRKLDGVFTFNLLAGKLSSCHEYKWMMEPTRPPIDWPEWTLNMVNIHQTSSGFGFCTQGKLRFVVSFCVPARKYPDGVRRMVGNGVLFQLWIRLIRGGGICPCVFVCQTALFFG